MTAEPTEAYHLHLEPPERRTVETALRLLIDDMAHTPAVRHPARRVLDRLAAMPPEGEPITLPLDPAELKVTHTALHTLLDDLGHDEADEVRQVRALLDKLPDEHAIRAIIL
jgi:hypothetical protein